MHDVVHGRFEYAFLNKNKTTMAKDTATGRNVCIKRWERGDLGAVNEISVLTSVSCEGVPGFICSFEDEQGNYMAEEWIDGVTLEEYMANRTGESEENATQIILNLCSVVDTLHKSGGYLHLDIKPSNIMINEKNEVYLIDFEGARQISACEEKETKTTMRVVSEGYSAPETFFGNGVIQSDVFSVGKVAEKLFSPIDDVSIYICGIIKKCTKFSIEERYENVLEIKKAFLNENNSEESISVLVDCNMSFSGELGILLTEKYNMSVGIFALSERGENRLIYYSMPGEYFTHRSEQNAFQVGDSSCIVSYPTIYSGRNKNNLFYKGIPEWIRMKCLHKVSEDKNLYISGMNFVEELILDDYTEAQDFIGWAKDHFDVVIIATDRNDDNVVSDIMCCLCDHIITTPQSNIDDIEAAYQFFKSHAIKNGYDTKKVFYVAWDYDEINSLPEEAIKIMVGHRQYLGSINRLDCREYKKNYGINGKIATPESNPGQYEKIINRLMNRKTGRF